VSCASVADCPQGQVCCGTLGGAGTYTAVSCQSTCGADAGTVQYPFCDLNAPVCPTGTTCRASTVLTGYAVCR
jgi:hypothetical protein